MDFHDFHNVIFENSELFAVEKRVEVSIFVQVGSIPHLSEEAHPDNRIDEEEQQQQRKHVTQRRQRLHDIAPM